MRPRLGEKSGLLKTPRATVLKKPKTFPSFQKIIHKSLELPTLFIISAESGSLQAFSRILRFFFTARKTKDIKYADTKFCVVNQGKKTENELDNLFQFSYTGLPLLNSCGENYVFHRAKHCRPPTSFRTNRLLIYGVTGRFSGSFCICSKRNALFFNLKQSKRITKMLFNLLQTIKAFAKDDRGVTTLEYGVLAAGIAVIIGAVVSSDGIFYETIDELFQRVLDSLPEASSSTTN